jgi:hypothetical protein
MASATEREPNNVGAVKAEHCDEPSQAVGIARHAQRLGRIVRTTCTWRVPGDDRVGVAQSIELIRPCGRSIPDIAVQEHDPCRACPNAFETDAQAIDFNPLHVESDLRLVSSNNGR